MRYEIPLRPDWQWPPLPARLPATMAEEIHRQHDQAMCTGNAVYLDPSTGLSVFTAEFLARRRYCCDSGCRHCPYEPEP